MMTYVKTIVLSLDLFGAELNLLYKRQKTYKSVLGGLITLFVSVLFLSAYLDELLSIINRSQVNSIQSQVYTNSTEIRLNSHNFFMALGVSGLNLTDKNPFLISVQELVKYSNGSKALLANLRASPCKADDRPNDKHFSQLFTVSRLSEWLCVRSGNESVLRGQFNSEEYRYIKVSISEGSSKQQIQKLAQPNGYVQLNLILNNYQVDLKNTWTNAQEDYTSLYFRFLPYHNQISHDVFLQAIEIRTDYGLLPISQVSTNLSFGYNGRSVWSSVLSEDREFCRVYLRVEQKKLLVERKVVSLIDYLSFLGGIFNAFFIIGNLIIRPYNQFRLHLSLFDRLFSIRPSQDLFHLDPMLDPDQGTLRTQIFNYQAERVRLQPDYLRFLQVEWSRFWSWLECGSDKLAKSDIKNYHQSLLTVQNQIDFQALVSRLILLEHSIHALLISEEALVIRLLRKAPLPQQAQTSSFLTDEVRAIQRLRESKRESSRRILRRVQSSLGVEFDRKQDYEVD